MNKPELTPSFSGNSIRPLYQPNGHTSNWVTTERMATTVELFDALALPSSIANAKSILGLWYAALVVTLCT